MGKDAKRRKVTQRLEMSQRRICSLGIMCDDTWIMREVLLQGFQLEGCLCCPGNEDRQV